MSTTTPNAEHPQLGKLGGSKKFGTHAWISLALAVVLLLTTVHLLSTPVAQVDGPGPALESREELLQKLANEGVIPWQSLEPAPRSREELLQKLANEGVIPWQSLEPAPRSREEITRDLINRGLIPRQTLDE